MVNPVPPAHPVRLDDLIEAIKKSTQTLWNS